MERERFDGTDVLHLLRARGVQLDWPRLRRRFGPHWRVLLSHLILFGFVYPAERATIPPHVLADLLRHLQPASEESTPSVPLCRGTLLSREQYLHDIQRLNYRDARCRRMGR